MSTVFQEGYEALYTGRSYQHEIGLVDALLDRRLPAERGAEKKKRSVLEVGCGPGLRLAVLNQWRGKYAPEGLDSSAELLGLARKRLPGVPVHRADMRNFSLSTRYDAVLCLFGVIGYMKDRGELVKAFTAMRKHLAPKGVLLLEPWLSPDQVKDGLVRTAVARRPGLEVTRMTATRVEGKKSVLSIKYLIGTDGQIQVHEQTRRLTLFTDEDYRTALAKAGFRNVALEAYGPQGRGLYVAEP